MMILYLGGTQKKLENASVLVMLHVFLPLMLIYAYISGHLLFLVLLLHLLPSGIRGHVSVTPKYYHGKLKLTPNFLVFLYVPFASYLACRPVTSLKLGNVYLD